MLPAPTKTTLKWSVPPTWVVLGVVSRRGQDEWGTELVHGNQPGWIDGGPPRGEPARGIARAPPVGDTALGAPAGGGLLGGGHFEGGGELARHGGG